MSIIKTLNFTDIEAPKSNRNAISTVDRARGKFLAAINMQIDAVAAFINGHTSYTVSKKSYATNDDGQRQRVNREVEVRPIWFEQDGQFFIALRYANKPLMLAKNKPSIAAGNTLETVRDVLVQIRDAVQAGELDKLLEQAAAEARQRLSKK